MNVRDIIYLDSGRLTSLLSQLMGGVAESGTESEVDSSHQNRLIKDEERQFGAKVSQQVERVREVRYFDHLLSQFLDRAGAGTLELSNDSLRITAAGALAHGSLVRASGPLFFDDFGQIAKSLEATPKYFGLLEQITANQMRASLSALEELTSANGQRRNLENERRRQKTALSATQNRLKDAQAMIVMVGSALDAFVGDTVECGVALSGEPPALVRALLDRACLREPMPALVQRYGMKTSARFTIIGTLTKASWMIAPSFGQPANDADESSAKPAFREAIQSAQRVFEELREQAMTVGGGDSVCLAPLVVFRELDLGKSA